MKKNRKAIKALVFISCSLVAAIALLVLFDLSNFEANDIDRHSLAYRISAPKHLESVVLVDECKRPKYRWKGRDGENAPFSSLSYGSSASPVDILEHYDAAFRKQSCKDENLVRTPELQHLFGMSCENQDFLSVSIFVAKEGTCRDVTIDFIENY